MAYDFIDQNIVASCLIQGHTDDSFYNPAINQHTGYAFDGNFYSLGVLQQTHTQASWFNEFGTNPFRGSTAAFPNFAIVLLSTVSMVILDQEKPVALATDLPLWMQFILGDNNAMANNFNAAVQGFKPSSVCYADGIVSITYSPDAGNQVSYVYPAWSNSTVYTAGAIVTYQGIRYEAVGTPVTGTPPTSDLSHWGIEITQPYPTPYPTIGTTSNMIVSVDFVQDSVYLDVAV